MKVQSRASRFQGWREAAKRPGLLWVFSTQRHGDTEARRMMGIVNDNGKTMPNPLCPCAFVTLC